MPHNSTFASNTNANCRGPDASNCFFDPNDSITVVSEFGLICDSRFLAPLTSTCYFIGVTFGALICGSLSDSLGRKRTIIACIFGEAIFGVIIYFTPNVFVLMALRMGHGFFVQGLQTITYTLVVEYTPVRFRNFIACFWPCYFGLGQIYLGGISMGVPDWRYLQLYLQIPIVIPLVMCWFVVESPLWLLSKNLLERAVKNYKKIAKCNNDDRFLAQEEISDQQQIELIGGRKAVIEGSDDESLEKDSPRPARSNLMQLFKNSILRRHLLSMISIW